ncbi:MAG: radical SAM protein [Novosphingobium sp.]
MPQGEATTIGWSNANPRSIESLQVIYKIAERCNINCSYCYYFNMGEETPKSRPAYGSGKVTQDLARWIEQGCTELEIPHTCVSFHGGEPTMIGLKAFDSACQTLRDTIDRSVRLSLTIQTNGVLLTEEWLDTFEQHGVSVGVSIDGPQAANDRYRLDHRGRSTFLATEKAIQRLATRHERGGPPPSTISVIDPANDYREVYRYLRSLGVRQMRFLLPDRNRDDIDFLDSGTAASYGESLSDLFKVWLEEDNQEIEIKFFSNMLMFFRQDLDPATPRRSARKSNQVIVAHSDGTVGVDDTYIPALSWYEKAPLHALAAGTLRNFLSDPIYPRIEELTNSIPAACRPCRWRDLCRGGDIENRYSIKNEFDNPSIYCDAYKVFYANVCDTLVDNGYPPELVLRKFGE